MISPAPWSVSEKRVYVKDANGENVCAVVRREDAMLLAHAAELLRTARIVLRGFDDAVFVRNIQDDDKPGWAIHLMPFVGALAQLQDSVRKIDEDQSNG